MRRNFPPDARGNPTGLYGPADSITMGQLAKVATLLARQTVTGTTTGPNWAQSYVSAATALHLSAFQNRSSADSLATRGAVILTILEALSIPMNDTGDGAYADVPAGSMYAAAVSTATRLGIVSGDAEKDTFRPNAPVNRAEVAKMVALSLHVAE